MEATYNFLTSGQKLKAAREYLGLKQRELECENLSRGMISLLETDNCKAVMTPALANKLAKRLNYLQQKIEVYLPYKLTADYLLEGVKEQAEKVIKNNINMLLVIKKDKGAFINILKKSERIIKCYEVDISLRLEIYKLSLKFFFDNSDFDMAEKYAYKCNDIYEKQNDTENIFLIKDKIIRINYLQEKYIRVIVVAESIRIDNIIIKMPEYQNVCFNTALADYELNQFNECLKWINRLKNFELPVEKELAVLNLKANVLGELSQYEEAEKEHLYIIEKSVQAENYDFAANSYSNLAEIYLRKKDIVKADEFIRSALSIDIKEEVIKGNVLLNAFLLSIIKNESKLARYYFKQALNIELKLKRYAKQQKLLDLYFDFCFSNCLGDEIKYILSVLNDMDVTKINAAGIYFKAAYYFNPDSDILKQGMLVLNKDMLKNI